MAKREESSNFAWFMAGLTIGVAGAILFAPKSGKETRDSIADAAARGRDLADQKRREAVKLGREVYERGREFAEEAKDAGRAVLTELSLRTDARESPDG